MDLDPYRERAERFLEDLDREHYRHFAGHKRDYEVEAIYDAYADLFEHRVVDELRGMVDGRQGNRRRLTDLLRFAFEGYLGRATRAESAELARREASLEVEDGNGALPYRMVPTEQANEADPRRREALEAERNALLVDRLDPLHREVLSRRQGLTRELGWASYAEACARLRGLDLEALARQASAFVCATEGVFASLVDPELERHAGTRLGEARRSDLPRFFRAPGLDGPFARGELVPSFSATLAGLGIDLERQGNVHLDIESRPTKSPRAFCATPRVPGEVHLVVAPVGGRDDYAALFHEGGHAEHYATTDPSLAFEHRHLGDNSVTESFAFLLEHLTEDPAWLRDRLGVTEPGPIVSHAHAARLVMLRRYAAKLEYELELHGPAADPRRMGRRYSELLSDALRVEWPAETWLADVDTGFYVACYLRAWALETRWRGALRERFGERWSRSREAGDWLRGLWRRGQALPADDLLAAALGEELDFGVLTSEFADGAGAAPAAEER